MSPAAAPYRWAILAVCGLGSMGLSYAALPVALGHVLDLTAGFTIAFTVCAVFEAVALAIAAFARESGGRTAV